MTRDEKIAEARRLRGEGMSYNDIGRRLDAAYTTVYEWVNPDEKDKRHERRAGIPVDQDQPRTIFPTNRPCTEPECGTVLSVFNPGPKCYCHTTKRRQSNNDDLIDLYGELMEQAA